MLATPLLIAGLLPSTLSAPVFVPPECDGFAQRLGQFLEPPGIPISGERLLAEIPTPCRASIDAGRWPELGKELGVRAPADSHARLILCLLVPPGTEGAVETLLIEGPPDYPDRYCAVGLLRRAPDRFARVIPIRFVLERGQDRWYVPTLALEVADDVRAEARGFLYPLLEQADLHRAWGRDRLYGALCEPSQPAAACRSGADQEPHWEQRERFRAKLPGLVANLGGALTYAVLAVGMRLRRGAHSVGWVFAAVGAAAVALMLMVFMTDGASGPVGAYAYLWALMLSPVAAGAAVALTFLFVRAVQIPGFLWSLIMAALYAALAIVRWCAV